MIIKTKDFILRPMKMSDAAAYVKYGSNKKISRNMLRMPYPVTLAYVKSRIKTALKAYKMLRPEYYNLAIEINGEFCGWISINHIEWGHKATIGYWLAEKHWGKGLMTKIVEKTTDWGIKKFKLKRIEASVFPFNHASTRVLVNNGFVCEGIQRKGFKKGKCYFDAHIYAKVK
jgi:RimJ/RimL family protein N-acetyltransferase